MPSLDVLLAPAACGKTEAAVQLLRDPRRGHALVLVPNARQQTLFKNRMAVRQRTMITTFYTLAALIFRRAGYPRPQLLGGYARTRLVRDILASLADGGKLPKYGQVATKPGFVAAVADLLNDLANADLSPEAVEGAARSSLDQELALVYRQYVMFQREHKLADLPRHLLMAAKLLEHDPSLLRGYSLLVADGFDQFTPIQQRMLRACAAALPRTVITLTGGEANRPAHRRFNRTLHELHQQFAVQTQVQPATPGHRHAALQHIEAHLFDLELPTERPDADGTVALVEAADREREVRAVLRHVHRLRQGGVDADDIAVVYRDGTPYHGLLAEIAAEYGLAIMADEGTALSESPIVGELLALLQLRNSEYPRRALMAALRSPYWHPGDQFAALRPDLLDAVARSQGIARRLERWLAALQTLIDTPPEEDAWISPEDAASQQTALRDLDAWLTPPATATLAEVVAWVRTIRAAVGVPAGVEGAEPDPLDEQDTAALQRLDRLLAEIDDAATIFGDGPTSADMLLADLVGAISTARFTVERNGVLVLSALQARGRCFQHVCVLGLSEGEFPRPLPEPAIYSRSQRRAMRNSGRLALPAPDPADERTIFYEVITRAHNSLLLSRTRLDEAGTPLARSPYLHALLDLVQGVQVTNVAAGSAPSAEEAVEAQERTLALADDLSANAAHADLPALQRRSNELRSEMPLWNAVLHARKVERGREGLGEYSEYEGVIHDQTTQALVAALFGPRHQWSITQLNDYLTCPFRFAAAHVLRVQPLGDPEDELDPARRGQLYHAILAQAGQRWQQTGLDMTTAHADAALDMLDETARIVLANAPETLGFAPSPFWEWEQSELRRRLQVALRGFIAFTSNDASWSQFRPAMFEQDFGGTAPLYVDTPSGRVRIRGRIDRVDQRGDGALALVDYKTAATGRPVGETIEGRDLQLPIYVLALQQAYGKPVERAAFFQIGSGKRGAEINGSVLQETVDNARKHIGDTIHAVRRAEFVVRPPGDCPSYCTFQTICRRNLLKRDAQPKPG